MTVPRRFARLGREQVPSRPLVFPIPDDGLCLSAFLLVRPPRRPGEVLVGKMNPAGAWVDAAGLDPARVAAFAGGWTLPASQLLFFEGPTAAARRVAAEQLRRPELEVGSPHVFSESYVRGTAGASDPHWDLHFVYTAEWPGGEVGDSRGTLWKELAFVPVAKTPANAFARGHADVLALAGLPTAPASPR